MPALTMKSTTECIGKMDVSSVADCVSVMRRQEETIYRQDDYLQENQHQLTKSVDEYCREKMAEWCYEICDYCKFHRNTVAVSMSLLDRFLSTDTGRPLLGDIKEYQLASMTTLHIAIKLNEPLEMDTNIMAELSRGCYTEREISDMESVILGALKWRVNGPTPLAFVHHFLALLPSKTSSSASMALFDFARFQVELAVSDYVLSVESNPSNVALAAVVNSMGYLGSSCISPKQKRRFLSKLEKVSGLQVNEVDEVAVKISCMLSKALGGSEIDVEEPDLVSDEASESSRMAWETRKTDSPQQAKSPTCVSKKA